MNLVDLPAVEFARLDPGLVMVQLVEGPCDGVHANVPDTGVELWQRVGAVGKSGVETQMWARYDCDPLTRRRYRYSGITVTTSELEAGLRAHELAGHTHGESRGA